MNFIEIKIEEHIQPSNPIRSFSNIYQVEKKSKVRYWLLGIICCLLLILFVPWTQNIRATGDITTLRQEQRPQQLNTVIPGKVAKWHVKEGDYVKAGDTIMQLAEIKDDYLDPNLLNRTKEQLTAKELSVQGYKSKAGTAEMQMDALMIAKALKISQIEKKSRQQRMKLQSDSMEIIAANKD